MSMDRNVSNSFMKASLYDQLAQYYKYTNPKMHIYFYQKHLKHINNVVYTLQTRTYQYEQSPQIGKIRILHISPDTPEIDIYVNGLRIYQNISFKKITNYLTLPKGTYQLDIYPTGTMVSSILSKKVIVAENKGYTITIIGSTQNIKLVTLEDHLTVPFGETKLKFVHLSPNIGPLDIAVQNGDVVFPNLSYKQSTNYLGLSPMIVNLEGRIVGSKKIALSIPSLHLKENEIYTIFILENKADEALQALVFGT